MTHAPDARPAAPAAAKPLAAFALAFLLLACAFANTPRGSRAQTAQTAPTGGAQPAAAVRLDVIFTDKSGRAVTDVKPEDVRVTEDGEQQTITRVALEEQPATYALLVDNSRSLGAFFDAIIQTGSSIVSTMKPDDEAAVIRFIDTRQIATLQNFTSDREELRDALESMYVEGGSTALLDAVEYAVKAVAERAGAGGGRRRAVVLLTDGEDRSSQARQEELLALLRREGVRVFAVALVGELSDRGGLVSKAPRSRAASLVDKIAEESGGRAFVIDDMRKLRAAADEIARNLRAQYAVEYRPTNAARDGKFRRVQVKAAGDRKVFARPGYVAEK